MSLKPGVDLRGLHPVWGVAYPIIRDVFRDCGSRCIVTSANDGRHSANSLHYKGMALDLRTKHVEEPIKSLIVKKLVEQLGSQFDVVLESLGLDNEHLHVEFDPKDAEQAEPA